jgi:hypothetical protein
MWKIACEVEVLGVSLTSGATDGHFACFCADVDASLAFSSFM